MHKSLRMKLATGATTLAVVCAGLQTTAFGLSEPGKSVSIFFTNDVHTAITPEYDRAGNQTTMGYAMASGIVDSRKSELGPASVTLVDDGDAVQGGPVGSLSEGKSIIKIMKAMGYKYAIPGNHEYDYGMDAFLGFVSEAQNASTGNTFTYLSSNFTKNGQLVLPASAIETYGVTPAEGDTDGAFKVAFVGVTTPESLVKSTPASFNDENGNQIYGFMEDSTGEKLYKAVQDAVDKAKADGADVVVLLAHLGEDGSTPRWTSDAVIQHTNGIDVVLDGHSHEVYDKTVNNKDGQAVRLIQTGTRLANIGELQLTPSAQDASKRIEVVMHNQSEGDPNKVDADTKAAVDEVQAETDAKTKEKITTSDVFLGVNKDNGEPYNNSARVMETNLGDLLTDAMRTVGKADIAILNGGGIRTVVNKGDVTFGDLLKVQPFNNELSVIEATGQQILDALEHGARQYPNENGGFLQVSGLTYKVDESVPSPVVTDDKGAFKEVAGKHRVYDVKVGNVPIDPNKTYRLAGIDYMLTKGGDGYTMFKGDKALMQGGTIDVNVTIDYIKNTLGAHIGSDYAEPQGRIAFAKMPEETPETPDNPNVPVTPAEPTGDNTNGDTTATPDKPADMSTKVKIDKPSAKKLPKTGDETTYVVLVLVASLGAGALGARRFMK